MIYLQPLTLQGLTPKQSVWFLSLKTRWVRFYLGWRIPALEGITWASCQIRKIADCACAGNVGNVYPHHRWLAIPTCIVPWCMPGSLLSRFLWSRWRGKRSRHSRRMRNTLSYVSQTYQHILSMLTHLVIWSITKGLVPKRIKNWKSCPNLHKWKLYVGK